jgi:pilus assembly protein CpaC
VHQIEVMVVGDARVLERTLQDVFPDANLTVYPVQQGCIINGSVTNADQVETVTRIAELHFPTVINNVEVAGVFTVQLETQILEVSRTKLRELGVDWAFANGDDFVSQTVSGLINATGTTFSGTGQETFKLGVIENSTSFFAGVRALRRNNLVKVLAEPKLVAVDGRPASFNSGGEIPIIIPAGLGQVAVQFREFGTRLDYVAKVLGNGRIWLEVRPYVSEVDPSRSVSLSGVSVPGFRSRYLETGVELGAGQTLALAGLLQVKSETINLGLPVLSDMPYLGALFRSTKEEQNEIELLITVTPNFAGGLDPHQVPCALPGLGSQSPTDKELYLRGYTESPAPDGCGPNCQPSGLLPPPGSAQFEPAQVYEGGIILPGGGPSQQMAPQVGPNPAAMSVAPHAPRLATRPQDNFAPYYEGGDAPTGGNPSTNPGNYPPGTVLR